MLSTRRTLGDLVDEVLYELGDDAGGSIWDRAQLLRIGVEGYHDFLRSAGIQWGVNYLPDLPRVANYTQEWERDPEITGSGFPLYERFNTTYPDEAEFSDALTQPAQITAWWEMEFLPEFGAATLPMPATAALPDDARDIARASNDRRCLSPMRRSELEATDYQYQRTRGPVVAFSLDSDGLQTLRKYRVPSIAADYPQVNIGLFGLLRASGGTLVTTTTTVASGGMRIDEFSRLPDASIDAADRERFISVGFAHRTSANTTTEYTSGPQPLTDLDTFAGLTVVGSGFGLLRRAPGLLPAGMKGRAGFGLVRRLHPWHNNTRIEYWGVGDVPDDRGNLRIELPRCYSRYVKHYVKWRAYSQDGAGHDAKLAQWYQQRYSAAVARAASRRTISKRTITAGSDGGTGTSGRPPRPQLPWPYGKSRR